MVVVLPAPFWPTIPQIDPNSTSNDIFSAATTDFWNNEVLKVLHSF
jgi:hypothetical protein